MEHNINNKEKQVLRKQNRWEGLYFYQKQLEQEFVTEGGIKERMTAARLGYRTNQKEEIAQLKQELEQAHRRIAELEAKLKAIEGKE